MFTAALAAAAFVAWRGVAHAPDAVGLSLLVILMLAIRNAWDLVTWLAPRSNAPRPPTAG
jgi:hypothetical protein